MRRMTDDVMREMNNNLKKKEQAGGNLAMKGEFLAAGIKSEVEGIKSALTDVYKWVRKYTLLIGLQSLIFILEYECDKRLSYRRHC